MTYRNRDLLNLARGAPCCAKFDHKCNPETVVSAHANYGKGMAEKVPDYAIAFLCHEAHRMIDEGGWTREISRAEWQRAHWRTMEYIWTHGFVTVSAPHTAPGDADEPRTPDQNDKAHAMLNDIAKQVKWHGVNLSAGVWKRLCTAAYLREIGAKPMMVPALDGMGMDVIYEPTSKMGKRKMAGLITWIEVFGAENNVRWTDPKWQNAPMVPEAL